MATSGDSGDERGDNKSEVDGDKIPNSRQKPVFRTPEHVIALWEEQQKTRENLSGESIEEDEGGDNAYLPLPGLLKVIASEKLDGVEEMDEKLKKEIGLRMEREGSRAAPSTNIQEDVVKLQKVIKETREQHQRTGSKEARRLSDLEEKLMSDRSTASAKVQNRKYSR